MNIYVEILKFALKLSRVQSRSASALIKLAAPELFDSDKPEKYNNKEYIELFRIQDKVGRGYESIAWPNSMDYELFWKIENNKSPEGRLPVPLGDEGLDPNEQQPSFYIGKFFAFESLDQVKKFFTEEQLDLLAKNGFQLEKVKAKRAWHSPAQVFYEPY